MKHVIIIAAIGITLSLILLTSPPYTKPNAEGSSHLGSISWANPDGSRGIITMTTHSLPRDGTQAWTNPDGTHGVVKTALGPSSATNSSWVNPDGYHQLHDQALLATSR